MPDTMTQPVVLSEFSVTEALSVGWEVVKKDWLSLLVAAIIYALATQVPVAIFQVVLGKQGPAAFLGVGLGMLWSVFMMIGLIRYMLALVRGQRPELGVLFSGADRYVTMLLVYIPFMVVVGFGMMLLIVPGIYLATKFAFAMVLIADGKSDGFDAFSKSSRMTEGRQLTLVLYYLVAAAMIIGGFMLVIIPGVVASMVVGVGTFLLYEFALANQQVNMPQPAMSQPQPPSAPQPPVPPTM